MMKPFITLQLFACLGVLATGINKCCSSLQEKYPEKVILPSNATYTTAMNGFWSGQERDVQPGCILRPTMADELTPVVHLAHMGCNFAIKGGGHTPFAGAANIQDGILVDLSGFDDITVNKERTVARIGAGQKWVNVYRKLDDMDLGVSGGRVATVGVAGLTLGGGLSFFSPRYGFVCDNVVNYEIILANGTLTSANATHDPSMFRALKGGSNNFGIVTSFSLRTFSQPRLSLWGGNILFAQTGAGLTSHFTAFESFVTTSKPDPYAAVIMNIAYSDRAKSWFIMHNLAYTKRKADPVALKGFTQIEGRIHDTLRYTNLTDLAMEFEAGIAAPGLRQVFVTLTTVPSAVLLEAIHSISQTCLAELLSVPGISWALSFQPITTAMVANQNNDYGAGNVMGLSAQDGNMVNILLIVSYDNRDDGEKVSQQIREFFKLAKEEARAVQGLKEYVYLNYAAEWQEPISSYGLENLAFLRNVSNQYDPNGIFQRRVPGGFKLFPPEERGPTTKKELPDILQRLLKAVKSGNEAGAMMEAQQREQEWMVRKMRESDEMMRMMREL